MKDTTSKNTWFTIATFLLACIFLNAQVVINSTEELVALKKTPLETVYVHHNASVLFPGEYIYYKFYCIDLGTYRFSKVSKVGYISLINTLGKTVLEQKVVLTKGQGSGDIFIPVSVPSGNYKLLGYTRWLLNGQKDHIFKSDIAIINPYVAESGSIVSNDSEETFSDSLQNTPTATSLLDQSDSILKVKLSASNIARRTKMVLRILSSRGALGHGTYSISVRKKDALDSVPRISAIEAANNYRGLPKNLTKNIKDSLIIPEQTGELIAFKVLDKDTQIPVTNMNMILSFLGTNTNLRSSTTDQNGNFYSYSRQTNLADTVYVQRADNDDPILLKPLTQDIPYTSSIAFHDFKITSSDEELIKQRSTYNQIENAFFEVKKDTVITEVRNIIYEIDAPEVFDLDAYTRFPTLKETFIEIVTNVQVQGFEGEQAIWVTEEVPEARDKLYVYYPPIILFDGVMVKNMAKILSFDARKVQSIHVYRKKFELAGNTYRGKISIDTKNNNFKDIIVGAGIAAGGLQKPAATKNYYNQSYETGVGLDYERIPDYRYQLYWQPSLNIDAKETSLYFYTSDVPGKYEVILEGFTTYGKPVSQIHEFTVK